MEAFVIAMTVLMGVKALTSLVLIRSNDFSRLTPNRREMIAKAIITASLAAWGLYSIMEGAM